MNQSKSTLESWQNLYESAAAFKRAECWNYFENIHIFGVENPMSGEIGYCCIMGNGGELYGMAVYFGSEGLETILGMFSGQSKTDPMFSQHCLMLSFDGRSDLYPAELEQIKELGLKFRGANAWPTFRLYEPGFVPYPLHKEEDIQFLTLALQQAIEVVQAYKHNPYDVVDVEEMTFLTRVSSRDKQNLVWSDQWLQPKPPKQVNIHIPEPINELRLAKVKRLLKGTGGIWEIDCFFAPMPINDGDRPYYPMMCLIVDQKSEFILQHGLTEKSGGPDKMAGLLLELIEKTQVKPQEIGVCREEVFQYIKQIVHALDINVYLTSELSALEEVKEGMLGNF